MKHRATLNQQIASLKRHGVTFILRSENEAKAFLSSKTYYYKLKSYINNYPEVKAERGHKSRGVDFEHLVELSIIDYSLSRTCLTLALAVEHAVKVRTNQLLMKSEDPGLGQSLARYATSGDYTDVRTNPYTATMWESCKDAPSVWNLWEVLSLSQQINLYGSYYRFKGEERAPFEDLLSIVRKLRNAVSHGNCLLADVNRPSEAVRTAKPRKGEGRRDDKSVTDKALDMCGLSKKRRDNKTNALNRALDRLVVNNFAALLLCHLEFVESGGVLSHAIANLESLINRIEANRGEYFGDKGREKALNKDVDQTLRAIQRLARGYIGKAEKKREKLLRRTLRNAPQEPPAPPRAPAPGDLLEPFYREQDPRPAPLLAPGPPVIAGTGIPYHEVVDLVETGSFTPAEVAESYSQEVSEDAVRQALDFADFITGRQTDDEHTGRT